MRPDQTEEQMALRYGDLVCIKHSLSDTRIVFLSAKGYQLFE